MTHFSRADLVPRGTATSLFLATLVVSACGPTASPTVERPRAAARRAAAPPPKAARPSEAARQYEQALVALKRVTRLKKTPLVTKVLPKPAPLLPAACRGGRVRADLGLFTVPRGDARFAKHARLPNLLFVVESVPAPSGSADEDEDEALNKPKIFHYCALYVRRSSAGGQTLAGRQVFTTVTKWPKLSASWHAFSGFSPLLVLRISNASAPGTVHFIDCSQPGFRELARMDGPARIAGTPDTGLQRMVITTKVTLHAGTPAYITLSRRTERTPDDADDKTSWEEEYDVLVADGKRLLVLRGAAKKRALATPRLAPYRTSKRGTLD